MTITPVEGEFVTKKKDNYHFVDANGRIVALPGRRASRCVFDVSAAGKTSDLEPAAAPWSAVATRNPVGRSGRDEPRVRLQKRYRSLSTSLSPVSSTSQICGLRGPLASA